MLSGHTVQLGDWGSFRLTLSGKGVDAEKDATPSTIEAIHIRFQPGKELKAALAQATFKSAASIQ